MRLNGRVYKDGRFWLAEVPMLDAMTQGRTREEALAMVADLLESLVNSPGFAVQVHPGKQAERDGGAKLRWPVAASAAGTQRIVLG